MHNIRRWILWVSVFFAILALQACTTITHRLRKDGPPRHDIRDVSRIPNAIPRYEAKSRYGNPKSYYALGKHYRVLPSARGYHQRGVASWYGRKFHGKLTADREIYSIWSMTAASPVLPIPCYVRVTNLQNRRTVIVRVNDRGPFASHRILDLSYVAARKLGYAQHGTAWVDVQAVDVWHHRYRKPSIHRKQPLYLQVGAFAIAQHATQLRVWLRTVIKQPVYIVPVHLPAQTVYRVYIGPLHSVTQSRKLLAWLRQYID